MEEPERFATVREDAIDKLLSDKDTGRILRSQQRYLLRNRYLC